MLASAAVTTTNLQRLILSLLPALCTGLAPVRFRETRKGRSISAHRRLAIKSSFGCGVLAEALPGAHSNRWFLARPLALPRAAFNVVDSLEQSRVQRGYSAVTYAKPGPSISASRARLAEARLPLRSYSD